MATVADLKKGQKGVILDFDKTSLPIKLLEMGCLPGNSVELVQMAPLKDPLYINIDGSHIAIRHDLARQIPITVVEDHKAL